MSIQSKLLPTDADDLAPTRVSGGIAGITAAMVTESSVHEFCTCASDLGWRAGFWPARAPTDMGNGQPFLLWSKSQDYAIYRQGNGCISLRVFND